jgi:hypothetical protein
MSQMAGRIGSILAVQLLGCTRTCRMAPEGWAIRLNWTYRISAQITDMRPPEPPNRTGKHILPAPHVRSRTRGRTSRDGKCWRPPWPVS